MTVRTRFAPSPTGYLHIGGARTALYSWLYAKHHDGKFVLRIEDTDRERSTEESIQAILDGMEWLGLTYDEGPFYQTKHMERYNEVIQQLLSEGKAYRCNCTSQRLDELRRKQVEEKHKPRYDGHCRDANLTEADGPFVIRFKNPLDGEVAIDDQVHGEIIIKNIELDDLIIARTDGTPTYNFTVVVDDWDMNITHVMRGDDHINNTPRQINILEALGAKIPLYTHMPMILGDDGKRLSKRHGAVSVMQYRDDGYLPEAVLNYIVRLGWSFGDQEIFSIDEMIKHFSLKNVNCSPAAFNTEKLQWLNQHYMKHMEPSEVAKHLQWQFDELGIDVSKGPRLEDIIPVQAERSKTLKEMAAKSIYFYQDVTEYDEKAVKNLKADIADPFAEVIKNLQQLTEWDSDQIHQVIIEVAEEFDLKLGKLAQPIRVALTGNTISPSIDDTIRLIGLERVVQRLNNAIEYIEKNAVKEEASS